MDISNKDEIIIPPKKFESSVVCKISIQGKLYSRCLSFMKARGFKESTMIQIALDKYLNEHNF